jgi:hypothetical protein
LSSLVGRHGILTIAAIFSEFDGTAELEFTSHNVVKVSICSRKILNSENSQPQSHGILVTDWIVAGDRFRVTDDF